MSENPSGNPTDAQLEKNQAKSSEIEPQDEVENEDEISQQMTASYSEISVKSEASPTVEAAAFSTALDQLKNLPLKDASHVSEPFLNSGQFAAPLESEGTVHREGNMTFFVTEDLEYKIKISSPVSQKEFPKPAPKEPAFNMQQNTALLNELETEAQKIATSIDSLTESLGEILHSISSITADNVEIYKDAVTKVSDSMDLNIKSMYTLLAKTEEVSEVIKGVQGHYTKVKELRKLVDLLDSFF